MEKQWYIAIVANNTEAASAEKLSKSFEVFVPTQKVVSVWKDGRKKVREKVLFPGKILVHCTEQERQELCNYSIIKRFLVDTTAQPTASGKRKMATMNPEQVEQLRNFYEQSCENAELWMQDAAVPSHC